MRVGIDASNLQGGGGVTHLVELLRHARPQEQGIDEVTVWGASRTLDRLPRGLPWLRTVPVPALEGGLLRRVLWRRFQLRAKARGACDVLFLPAGSYGGSFRPYVIMFRNMLPFVRKEMWRYAWSFTFFRLAALRMLQGRSFRHAQGLIFLTEPAREIVLGTTHSIAGSTVIPHGVSDQFRRRPVEQQSLAHYTMERPFRFLYTSIIDLYKHQWNVVEAVLMLRKEGLPVALDLVGPAYPPALARVISVLDRFPGERDAVRILGEVSHDDLPRVYHEADAFIFASTCENMPNVLIEAMAAGLPIASSSSPPMPAILKDGAVFFDAEDVASTAGALRALATDASLRQRVAGLAFDLAQQYSWRRCADETFAFLAKVGAAAGD